MYSWGPGNRVNWRYEARGGYGYSQRVAAIVRKVGPKRITIEVAERDIVSGEWVRKLTSVKPENLSPRAALCAELGECEAANV
jgi:hypothetical protein